MLRFVFIVMLFIIARPVVAADEEFQLLWPDGAPGAMGEEDKDKPGFWIYPAEKPNGAAVVICPGGGYVVHATDHEGVQPARFFNRMGVTAFVLRYRLSPYRHPIPMGDAQRAIRVVRANAEKYGVDPARVGIMGFSAGGHLTSTAVTHFDAGKADAVDPIERQSCRPSFGILGYPVVSFVAEYSHKGSARNLLGEDPTQEQLESLSNDTQVTNETPPVFFFHTAEDTAVPAENSLAFYAACLKHKVPAELHVYQQGPHGVGLANEHPALESWIGLAGTWLRQNGLLTGLKRQAISGTITLGDKPMRWGCVAFKTNDSNLPVAWAMVNNGKYSIPASSGAVRGSYSLVVTDMGAVAPGPTLEDARVAHPRGMTVFVEDGVNTFDLAFMTKDGEQNGERGASSSR